MAVSTRTRFEVFKRDGFACQYCGRRKEDDGVKLHVDHVIPVKEGGGDEMDNLVTACQDCNLGKAAKLLDDRAPVTQIEQRVHELVQRRLRLEEYREERARIEADVSRAWNHWFSVWGVQSLPRHHCPWKSTLRKYVESIGVDQVCEAIDICDDKFRYVNNDAVRYLIGVLRHKEASFEGRVVECIYCKRRIVVDSPEEAEKDWWHVACAEEAAERERIARVYDICWLADAAAGADEIDLEVAAWDRLAREAV